MLMRSLALIGNTTPWASFMGSISCFGNSRKIAADVSIDATNTPVQNRLNPKRFWNQRTSAFLIWSSRKDKARKDSNSVVKPVRKIIKVMSRAS